MTPLGFPLPGLVYFGFTALLGLRPYGPEEKMRWGIAFDFKGGTFGFELRKFGLRALCEPRNLDSPLLREVLGCSRALTALVERHLAATVVEPQLEAGNFTMENLYCQLNERYRFLRRQAEEAYARPPSPPVTEQTPSGSVTHYDYGRPRREGGALAGAAVDAYFSLLEHFFCLAVPFAHPTAPPDSAKEVLASTWPTKAKRVLNLADPVAKTLYDGLIAVREDWRNPLAHGGFLGGGGSLHFHVPNVGSLPVRLRRTPLGARVAFQLPRASFAEIAGLFDEFDQYVADGPLRFARAWAESGLHVAFDAESTKRYRSAMTDEGLFAQLIDDESRLSDYHANMEY